MLKTNEKIKSTQAIKSTVNKNCQKCDNSLTDSKN